MSSSGPLPVTSLKFAVIFMAIPYLIGLAISHANQDALRKLLSPLLSRYGSQSSNRPQRELIMETMADVEGCYRRLVAANGESSFDNLAVFVHRNGDPVACGDSGTTDIPSLVKDTLQTIGKCPEEKYQFESFLTRLLHAVASKTCHSVEPDRSPSEGFYGFCDMTEARTPILLDHASLVAIPVADDRGRNDTYLPCHFHTREGVRVTSAQNWVELARQAKCSRDEETDACLGRRELHLYAVPAGRMFHFAPSHVGEIFDLPHVQGGDPTQPVYMKVLSLKPRVFDLFNFFTREESVDLVDRAHKETRDTHRIKRSSTGASGYNINPRRTSESGYDTHGKTSMEVKRRCFKVLGFDEYIEGHADGLQMLRYNLTTAYISHMDYIDGNDQLEHDYDTAHKGGNRFATILLYMTDLGEKDGGETVFTEARLVGQAEEDQVDLKTALRELRESGDAGMLEEGSWQEEMVAKCRTRLAIRPHSGRSVLFYSQLPNGEEDRSSLHGGCPVLAGTKYAANLWVWNTPRPGYQGNPKNPRYKGAAEEEPESAYEKKKATFRNTGKNPDYANAKLYFGDDFWSDLDANGPAVGVNTYETHVWNVKVNDQTIASWTIEKEKEYQFEI